MSRDGKTLPADCPTCQHFLSLKSLHKAYLLSLADKGFTDREIAIGASLALADFLLNEKGFDKKRFLDLMGASWDFVISKEGTRQ